MNRLSQVIAQLKDKRIVVLGAGLTGMSCVHFVAEHQLTCLVNDSRSNILEQQEFKQNYPQCQLVQGRWALEDIAQAEVILVSPGIDLVQEQLISVIKPECELIGDVELFARITDKPILAVTGSNGKSTVVSLLAHVGRQLGFTIGLGGNIGTPVLEQLAQDVDCYVLELSSFQLETLSSMSAVATTVLNISDDHLDRHKTLTNYSKIKQKIYSFAKTLVVNRDDPLSFSEVDLNGDNLLSFGEGNGVNHFGLSQENGEYVLSFAGTTLVNLSQLPLAGKHNALNYLAVLALGYCMQWPVTEMIKHFASFSGLEHRCQRVPSDDGIFWINDSKATNVGATLAAINGLAGTMSSSNKLILIAGGDGKGADFSPLKSAISRHVAQVFTLGKDGAAIALQSENAKQVDDLASAVSMAKELANTGDVVLLSPACASLDMFKNFAERGQVFMQAVSALQEAS